MVLGVNILMLFQNEIMDASCHVPTLVGNIVDNEIMGALIIWCMMGQLVDNEIINASVIIIKSITL